MAHIEKTLHARFAEKRVKGEWFNLNSSDLRAIAGVLPNKIEVKW